MSAAPVACGGAGPPACAAGRSHAPLVTSRRRWRRSSCDALAWHMRRKFERDSVCGGAAGAHGRSVTREPLTSPEAPSGLVGPGPASLRLRFVFVGGNELYYVVLCTVYRYASVVTAHCFSALETGGPAIRAMLEVEPGAGET